MGGGGRILKILRFISLFNVSFVEENEGFEVMKNGVGECDDRNKWRNLPEVFHGAVLNRIGLKNS